MVTWVQGAIWVWGVRWATEDIWGVPWVEDLVVHTSMVPMGLSIMEHTMACILGIEVDIPMRTSPWVKAQIIDTQGQDTLTQEKLAMGQDMNAIQGQHQDLTALGMHSYQEKDCPILMRTDICRT